MNSFFPAEPLRVSLRFRLSIEATIRDLLRGAAFDERLLPLLDDPGHRRRQALLVHGQLERAYCLMELLRQAAPSARRRAA